MKLRYVSYLILSIYFVACSADRGIKNEIPASSYLYLKKNNVLDDKDTILKFWSSTFLERSGSYITQKKIGSYWIDDISTQLNYKKQASFDSIVDLRLYLKNKDNAYAPFLIVKKINGEIFRVSVFGEKNEVQTFYETALNKWKENENYSKNLILHEIILPHKIISRIDSIEGFKNFNDFKKINKDSFFIALNMLQDYEFVPEVVPSLIDKYLQIKSNSSRFYDLYKIKKYLSRNVKETKKVIIDKIPFVKEKYKKGDIELIQFCELIRIFGIDEENYGLKPLCKNDTLNTTTQTK